jgi:hypothetical protein
MSNVFSARLIFLTQEQKEIMRSWTVFGCGAIAFARILWIGYSNGFSRSMGLTGLKMEMREWS